ncbi:armadillo-type protein [Mycena leptocephala]|nr:armadillo-type protein [Mycena leptocephala]
MPPPPTRPRTPESIHSWWSDSNPVGPTISIHAVAKPLMRLMYHEQVRSFIKRNHGTLLSRATLEICFSYLVYKYISPATKMLILKELTVRAEVHEDATTMLDSFLVEWDLVVELLGSSDSQTRRDDDIEVRESALHAVAKITETPDGARAVRDLKVWEYLPESAEHLDFSRPQMEQSWCSILSNLANYAIEVLGSSTTDIDDRRDAVYMLSQVGYRPYGAKSGAGALKYVPELLFSTDTRTLARTCELVGGMAFYKFTSAAQLGVESCTRIVALLGDDDKHVHSAAMLALWGINYHLVDAHTLAHPTILAHFAEHLDSSVPGIRQLACRTLEALAGSHPASLVSLCFDLCVRIAPLLSDIDIEVRRSAVHALSELSYWSDGSPALEAQIAERVPQLLTSSDTDTVRSTCEMLENMGYHNHKVDAKLCEHLLALLSDEDVREAAIQALAKISRSSGGAHAIGNTTILDHVAGLLDFEKTRFAILDTLSNLVFYRAIPSLDTVLKVQITPFLNDPDNDISERALSALLY